MKGEGLDWKIKTVLLVFAPCTQLTFLGAFIYYWMKDESEKEVGIVNVIIVSYNSGNIYQD